MFWFGPKRGDVLSHWYSLIPGFSMPVKDFYTLLETELKAREVPNLDMRRIDFAEGGLLSTNRTYLRMQRETLVFDICGAQFGTSFFFSCRFAEIPVEVTIWHFIALLMMGVLTFYLFFKLFAFWGIFLFPLFVVGAIYVLRNAISLGLSDLDVTLSKSPLVGPIYIRFFRKETYYRQDTRLMYCDTVNQLAKEAVEAVTGAKGIEMIRYNERSPFLEELYKPRFVKMLEPKSKA
jgi:hypothetical protein